MKKYIFLIFIIIFIHYIIFVNEINNISFIYSEPCIETYSSFNYIENKTNIINNIEITGNLADIFKTKSLLDNIDIDILRHINKINIHNYVNNICNDNNAIGCTTIYFSYNSNKKEVSYANIDIIPSENYGKRISNTEILGGSFEYTLYHEIGHVYNNLNNIYDSEDNADNYADKYFIKLYNISEKDYYDDNIKDDPIDISNLSNSEIIENMIIETKDEQYKNEIKLILQYKSSKNILKNISKVIILQTMDDPFKSNFITFAQWDPENHILYLLPRTAYDRFHNGYTFVDAVFWGINQISGKEEYKYNYDNFKNDCKRNKSICGDIFKH